MSWTDICGNCDSSRADCECGNWSIVKTEISDDITKQALLLKSHKMKRDTWVRNVMKIYPDKNKEETENLYDKIFKK